MGGNETSTSEYQQGKLVSSITQLGLIFTPGGAEEGGALLVENVSSRAEALHGLLSPIAQRMRTTAVMDAIDSSGNSITLVASSRGTVGPLIRNALNVGEIAVKGAAGMHAEQKLLGAAEQMGLTPIAMSISRTSCGACAALMRMAGL